MLDADRYRLCVVQRQRAADGRGRVEPVDAGRERGGGRHPRHRHGARGVPGAAQSAPRRVRALSPLLPRRLRRGSAAGRARRAERDRQQQPQALSDVQVHASRDRHGARAGPGARSRAGAGAAGDGGHEHDGRHPVRLRCDGRSEDGAGDAGRGEVQHPVHGGRGHRPPAGDARRSSRRRRSATPGCWRWPPAWRRASIRPRTRCRCSTHPWTCGSRPPTGG